MASRTRSREEKDHAAQLAQARAAANRNEVLRDAALMTEQNERRSRSRDRQRPRSDSHGSSFGTVNDPRNQGQSRGIRFGVNVNYREGARRRSVERERPSSSKNHTQTSKAPKHAKENENPQSWTSRVKAYTQPGKRGEPATSDTKTTVYPSQTPHQQYARGHTFAGPPTGTHQGPPSLAGHHSHQTPLPPAPVPYQHIVTPKVSTHQPTPHSEPSLPPSLASAPFQHHTHSTPGHRIDVYLGPGSSNWQVFDPQHGTLPMPNPPCKPPQPEISTKLNMTEPSGQPSKQFSPSSAPPKAHPRPLQAQVPRPPPTPQKSAPQTQPLRSQAQTPAAQKPPAASHVRSTPQASAQQGNKIRQPRWDDQSQTVVWEWR
jgi:hypothetical protein